MRVYTGRRDRNGIAVVRVIGSDGETHALAARLDLARHSPTGFEYGYGGSGPAQLALAILADALRNDELAVMLHQEFKALVIAPLTPHAPWQLSQGRVIDVAGVLIARRLLKSVASESAMLKNSALALASILKKGESS